MTGLEPRLIKLSLYLSGLSQKCIVAGIKKWKETRDQQKAAADIKLIEEYEFAKSVETKIGQQITVSIRDMRLTPELIQEILSLETNPLIKSQLTEKFLLSDISPEFIEELFASQNPALQEHRDTLHLLGICWLDAIDKVVANNHQLQGIISFRGLRAIRRDMKNLEAELFKANLRADQAEISAERHQEELLAAFTKIPGYGLSTSKDAEDSIPEHLKSLTQKRFDRAKNHLTNGSVVDAEREFQGLIEVIEALKLDHDPDLLLMRSYLNLASSLWEQSRQNDATIWFDKAYALNPDDWRAKRGRAFALINRNHVNEALAIFAEIRQLRPNESEHICNQAWILKNNGRVGEAIRLLETNPFDDVYYHSILAFSYARAERYEGGTFAHVGSDLSC
jgi:tetratricopeptide (TPR) repeat protein